MLSDAIFFSQSMEANLYYLRTIREFCASIQLAFFENESEYINEAEAFALKCEALGEKAISYSDGNLSKSMLDSGIFVTEYTLPCELLTEKLFSVDINTDLTERELALKPGNLSNPSEEMLDNVMQLNKDALVLVNEFISFCTGIIEQLGNLELFSYLYIDYFNYVVDESNIFKQDLERLISMEAVSPIYVTDYEYYSNDALKKTAAFIRGWVDPIHQDIFDEANYFVKEFANLANQYLDINLSPEVQAELNNKSLDLVEKYRIFMSNTITKLLESEAYFIVSPISLDNIYTNINYYKYNLLTTFNQNIAS